MSDLKMTWKIIISYFLVDQAFAVTNPYLKKIIIRIEYFTHLVLEQHVGLFGN